MMESLIKAWDGQSVMVRFDQPSGAWTFIAIHSTRLGPATGGTRLKNYPNLEAALQDALRLAAGMTYKFAAGGLAYGGAKAVIAVPPDLTPEARAGLLRRHGAFVQQLGGLFLTGPDLGTSPEDMDIIAENGAPYVFSRTVARGGAGDPGPFTALGVFSGIRVTCSRLFGDAPNPLEGRRILVQGVGSVGRDLINRLRSSGAEILFSEVRPELIGHFRAELGLPFIPAEEVYDTPCDIFAPCALGGILNEETIPRLRCQAVAGAANNQLGSPADAARLHDRGILYAPDFILNIGGAIALIGIETEGISPVEAEARIVQSVKTNLAQVFALAENEGLTSDVAARRLAETRLASGGE